MFVSSKSIPSPIFIALHLAVSEIANVFLEVIYCCFTRTALFTTMFTVIILVCPLKSMCIPSFILISCCVSEFYAHLCPYCLRLFTKF